MPLLSEMASAGFQLPVYEIARLSPFHAAICHASVDFTRESGNTDQRVVWAEFLAPTTAMPMLAEMRRGGHAIARSRD